MVLCKNSKMDSFSYLRIKNFIFLALSRFPVKCVCCIAFGPASSACCKES